MKIKNKKAEIEGMAKVILWIVFFVILMAGIYYLIKRLTGI